MDTILAILHQSFYLYRTDICFLQTGILTLVICVEFWENPWDMAEAEFWRTETRKKHFGQNVKRYFHM